MKKVLIIDDEVDFCLLLKAYLTRYKYDVYYAHTLSEGMEKAKKIIPEVIFLDNNLPDGLGWERAPYFMDQYPGLHLNLISAYHPDLPNVRITPELKIWEKPISLSELESYLTTD